MQRSPSKSRTDERNFASGTALNILTCSRCRKSFQKSIPATIFSRGQTQTYDACPHCLTKIPSREVPRKQEEETTIPEVKTKKRGAEQEATTGCAHSFGYLRQRQKDVPIPEECLTCSKLVECLLH